jgi:hypothetical protein
MNDDLLAEIQKIDELVNKNEENVMKTIRKINQLVENNKDYYLMEKMIELNFGGHCNKLKIAKLDGLDEIVDPNNLTDIPVEEIPVSVYSQYYNHYYTVSVINI